ncbi:DsbA family oxidoreductase [Frigidibacter sp. MR17.14]|uniref:DsbA family oxidoreductase n=1 Tax=Frigidibacter sp. MR17.14 TaxID=3126509 RepID=UPI003012A25D
MIRLDIIADFACPWCYLGKAMLDRALEARPAHPLLLAWHPYQLDPGLPPEGMDRVEYMKARFGSVDAILKVHEPLLEHAAAAGVELNLPAIERTPNTLNAHRLTHWAGIEGRQAAVVSALYRAYWREGRDIGDSATLTGIAGAAGMDGDMVARLLDSDADREGVTARIRHAAERGVRSVPTFIVADTHAISGAQPPELWTEVIDELLAKDQPDAE